MNVPFSRRAFTRQNLRFKHPSVAHIRLPLRPHAVLKCSSRFTCSRTSKTKQLGIGDGRQHHDLESFLAYAQRKNVDTSSTTYVGTKYEYIVLAALRRLGFNLIRTGGRLDQGIDLIGTWSLPCFSNTQPMRVIVQCKALSRKSSPSVVRELEGSIANAPKVFAACSSILQQEHISSNTTAVSLAAALEPALDLQEQGEEQEEEEGEEAPQFIASESESGASGAYTMALLATSAEATQGVREALGRSRYPMGFLKVDVDETNASRGIQSRGASDSLDADIRNDDDSESASESSTKITTTGHETHPGTITQFLWNRSASEKAGLAGLNVALRYRYITLSEQKTKETKQTKKKKQQQMEQSEAPVTELKSEVVLTFNGTVVSG